MYHSYAFIFCCLFACSLAGQSRPELLKLHLDPRFPPYGTQFILNDIVYVDFVSDRRLADVQLQSWEEPLQNGAKRYRYIFFGYGRFAGQNDTVTWHIEPLENEISISYKSLAAVKQGLLPYLLQTPLRQSLRYEVGPAPDTVAERNPWRRWTIQAGLVVHSDGHIFRDTNGLTGRIDNRMHQTIFQPSLSVWHIGHKWRAGFDAGCYANWGQKSSRAGTDNVKNKYWELSGNAYAIYSLTSRWSLGTGLSWSHNRNDLSKIQLRTGVEYSFLPYRDFFRRRLILGYSWQKRVDNNNLEPNVGGYHNLYVQWSKTQKWGFFVVNSGLTGTLYYRVVSDYTWNGSVRVAVNIAKNLFIVGDVKTEWTNRYYKEILVIGGSTVEAHRAQLLEYYFSVGISCYFGSWYRNVINPRQVALFN